MSADFPVLSPNRELFQERLNLLAKEGGRKSRKALSALTGVPVSSLDKYATGSREPSFDYLVRIAQGAGVSLDWLSGLSDERTASAGSDFVAIPLLPEPVSAGEGSVAAANDAGIDKLLMFRREWVRDLGVNPLHAHLVRVKGDSMTPTLYQGDVVLVDASDRDPVGGGLYVMMKGDEAVVKRLDRDFDGALIVISDNRADYPPNRIERDQAEHVRIIGRVRWYARTLR